MKAKAKLKGALTGLGSGGFISVLNKTYHITFAQNPVSKYILVEIETTTGLTGVGPECQVITGTRSVIHDDWVEFHRLWNVVEEVDSTVKPEGY
jgi:hypothetical protein